MNQVNVVMCKYDEANNTRFKEYEEQNFFDIYDYTYLLLAAMQA